MLPCGTIEFQGENEKDNNYIYLTYIFNVIFIFKYFIDNQDNYGGEIDTIQLL